MLHPWIIKIEIKGEMPCANLQSNTEWGIRAGDGKKIYNLKSQFRREYKKVKKSEKVGFPLKVQLVWLPTVIIPTPRDGVKRQSKYRL